MKYINFYQKLKNSYPILSRRDIDKIAGNKILDTQLSDWVKKKLLVKRRDFSEDDIGKGDYFLVFAAAS